MQTVFSYLLLSLFLASCLTLGYSRSTNTKTILYQEEPGNRMVHVTLPQNSTNPDDMLDCVMFGVKISASEISADESITVDRANMTKLINKCTEYQKTHFDWSEWTKKMIPGSDRSIFDNLLIFPGTKYCGAGNISENYNDLGADRQADACCRKHDTCPDSIPTGEEKHGIKNPNLLTANLCECDNLLYECLMKANSIVSNTVGVFYFNLLRQKCFENSYPIKPCIRIPLLRKCDKPQYDTSKPKEWRFVDPKFYNPISAYINF